MNYNYYNENYDDNEEYDDNDKYNNNENYDEYDNNEEHENDYYNNDNNYRYYYYNYPNYYYNNYYNQYNNYENYYNDYYNYSNPYEDMYNYYKMFSKETKDKEEQIGPDIEKPSNDFHSLLQYKYILDENPENIYKYANGFQSLSKPDGILLDFSDSIDGSSDSYVIQISSSQEFDSSYTKIIKNLTEKKYILQNLKLGQTIYYRGATEENKLSSSKIYNITVNNLPPRNLDIPGVDNARDLGGYKTKLVENGIINQGLFYRTANIDYIKKEGKKILLEDLGIKIEIDLREAIWNTRTPFLGEIEYYAIPMSISIWNKEMRFDEFDEIYKKVYHLISEADKKPILLHCIAGADRTGIMSFSLLALLGCEYKDIAKDYLFTNFGYQGYRELDTEFKMWWRKLQNFEGKTTAEKCKNWLMTKGIEESTIEHIRAIFIDGYKENISLDNKKE